MEVRRIPTYGMASNCYVISDGRESAVVDPSAKLEYITAALADAGTELKYILLTHGHFDHTKTLTKLREATGAEVCVHADDDEMLSDSDKNAYSLFNVGTQNAESADILLHDGDRLKVGSATVTVIHTPGHSKGSVCYHTGRDLFTGDTLFLDSVGRTDFYGSSSEALSHSLKRLTDLPGDYTVYPGHGESTSLERERQHNPYLKCID